MKTTEAVNIKNDCKTKTSNICEENFNSKRDLLLHLKENHPKRVRCKSCVEIFDKNSDLEKHIKANHEQMENYDCEKCEKTFVLKWRLTKHQENHSRLKDKKCHYFNNKRTCPC